MATKILSKREVARALKIKVGNIKRAAKILRVCVPTLLKYAWKYRLRDPRRAKVSRSTLVRLLKVYPASDVSAHVGISMQSLARYIELYGLRPLADKTRARVVPDRIAKATLGLKKPDGFQSGSKNHRWRGGCGEMYHRTLAFRDYGFEKRCYNAKCRSKLSEEIMAQIVEIHHINGNRYDNRKKNMLPLCPNCHTLETRKIERIKPCQSTRSLRG